MRRTNYIIWLIIFNILVLSSTNTLVMPFLLMYLKEDLFCTQDTLSFYTASCYSITFIVSMIAAPLWGKLSDKIGKKSMLLRVLILLVISYYLASICTSALQFLLVRAFQGLACGMTPALLAFVTTHSEQQDTGKHMGLVQSSNLIGAIIGPCLGGLIAQFFGVRTCFYLMQVLVLALLLLDVVFIKEPQKIEEKAVSSSHTPLSKLLQDPILQSLSSCMFVHALVIMMIVPMLSDYVIRLSAKENDLPIALSGIIFSLSGIAGAICSPFWGSRGSQKGYLRILHIAVLGASIFYLVIFNVTNIYLFALVQFLFGTCICAIAPCCHSIGAKRFNKDDHTKVFAILYSFSQLGNLTGPIVGTLVITFLDSQYVFLTISSILLFLSIYLLSIIEINSKKTS